MQIIVLLFTIIVLLCRYKSKGYSELIEKLGCHDTQFRLSCESLKANIVIFEASFSQNGSLLEPLKISCGRPDHQFDKNNSKFYQVGLWENLFQQTNNSFGAFEVNFRHAINRRCSGVNYCSFKLSEDFEVASSLGPGVVYLRYACVDGIHLTKACNSNIDVSAEGFVSTPGYPDYYVGETTCLWTLKAPPPQKVKIAFLDVSLRGVTSYEKGCLDWLIVAEDGLNLLSTCGDILEDVLILSDGPALNVTFRSTSKTLFPKRGFLFHYKAVGCPNLRKPRDGYLINRNETFVHYRCCAGFLFPDTLSRDKILKCFNENAWNGIMLDCISMTELIREKNNSIGFIQGPASEAKVMEKRDFLKDVIVPSVIMCIIFIGNGVMLYFIHRLRRRRKRIIKRSHRRDGNRLAAIEKMELKEIPKEKLEA